MTVGDRSRPQGKQIAHLDSARGLAALAVCASHLRAFQFVPLPQAHAPSLLERAFYLLTGCGHQAVMVFFVLSGYFVAGSVADSLACGSWSWSGYALRRLTRLWLVLIPALGLTAIWDQLGLHFARGGYDGRYANVLFSGPVANPPFDGSWLAFIGNAFFMQTICSPVYGSNSPLWSLANEFWYYLLFPLCTLAVLRGTGSRQRILCGVLFLVIAWLLPRSLMKGFLVWLLGFGVFCCMKFPRFAAIVASRFFFAVFVVAFAFCLLLTRAGTAGASDFLLALTFAGLMPFLIRNQPKPGWYRRIATALSEVSYTLYVTHFPFLAFLFFTFFLPGRRQPGGTAYLLFALLLASTLLYAFALWWLFERHTDRFRRWLRSRLAVA